MKTLWKKVTLCDGYAVSNTGEVVSYKGKIPHTMTKRPDKDGYDFVDLHFNGKQTTVRVQKIVALAFLPNPDNLTEINHKDENKHNNFVYVNDDGSVDLEKSNLEWCTHRHNCNHGTRNERVTKCMKNRPKLKNLWRYHSPETIIFS